MKNSIVQIKTLSTSPAPSQPWAISINEKKTSTGFIIEHNMEICIITNAHCVTNATSIHFKFSNETEQFPATVVRLNHECDLAILKCTNTNFLTKAVPLQLAEALPKQGSKLVVYGFPNGHDFSLTKGSLSRIDVKPYVWKQSMLLILSITALSQPGNSGGPLMHDEKVIGVVHQGEQGGGYNFAIPLPVLLHFLQNPEGFPELSIKAQKLDSGAIKKNFKLKDNQGGILVTDINSYSCAYGILKAHDIILEIDGYPLDNQGKIKHPVCEVPIPFTHAISMHALGDTIELIILRNQTELTVKITLNKTLHKGDLMKIVRGEDQFQYLCKNGIVFIPLTTNYHRFLMTKSSAGAGELQKLKSAPSSKSPGISKLFVISKVLDCQKTSNLQTFEGCVVREINGKKIGSWCKLFEAFENPTDGIHHIRTSDGLLMCIEEFSEEENNELFETFGIRSRCTTKMEKTLLAHKSHRDAIKPLSNIPLPSALPTICASTSSVTLTLPSLSGNRFSFINKDEDSQYLKRRKITATLSDSSRLSESKSFDEKVESGDAPGASNIPDIAERAPEDSDTLPKISR